MAAYAEKTWPLVADVATQGSVGAREVASTLSTNHKLPARGKSQLALTGADASFSAVLDALDYFKLDVEAGPPIGGIMAVAGTYTATGNGGSYSETGIVVGANWKLTDGTVISDAASPFNGRYVPQINDGRFLRGNATAGTAGGSQTQNPSSAFAAAGSYTPAGTVAGHQLTAAEMPSHTHSYGQVGSNEFVAGTSSAFIGNGSTYTTGSAGSDGTHSHGWTGGAEARSNFFVNSSVNIEPLYLNVKYYQRIK